MFFQANLYADGYVENPEQEDIENYLEELDVTDKDVAGFEVYADIEESFEEDHSVYISEEELEKVLKASFVAN